MSANGGRFGHGRADNFWLSNSACRRASCRVRTAAGCWPGGVGVGPGGCGVRSGWWRCVHAGRGAGPARRPTFRFRCCRWVRRADAAEVVGAGLELAAVGWGCRRIAERLGRPVTTVRGWLRCWSRRAGRTAAVFTAWLVALADDPASVLP
ncbi:helix-turn-helix domain-containing protein [Streptomyces sp. NPDC054834]